MSKCPSCGGDAVEEGFAHCSAECLLNAATKHLLAMHSDKVDERANDMLHDHVNHPSHYTAYKGLEVIGEDHPEQPLVWICYITDNHGNPLVVKVVSTKKKAREWLGDEPHAMGKKDDDKVRGNRFVESFVVEAD